jgi:hypothetical protein
MILMGNIFKSDWHTGDGYKIKFPAGWVLDKTQSSKVDFFSTTYKPEQIAYSTQERNGTTDRPAATISMYTNKLAQAMWIQDEFPGMIAAMKAQGLQVKQKGEIKVDNRIHEWVLYKNPSNGTLTMEFYQVDDSNFIYKLSFITYPQYFDKYRPDFEAAKATLKYTRFSFDQ